MTPLICIIKRQGAVGRLAPYDLESEGCIVRTLTMGSAILQQVERLQASLIIIETATLAGRALELCREFRTSHSLSATPVIYLSSTISEDQRVLGLELGADDCIAHSSSAREIVARVQAVLRRYARKNGQSGACFSPPALHSLVGTLCPAKRTGDIEIDTAAMRILVRGNEIPTTSLEFRLLYYLVHNEARVFTRDQLLDAVWGPVYVELRSVDACVRRLRRKMEPNPLHPTYLQTVRGVGYCLRAEAAAATRRPTV
jgi:DNA-binding response OmpR family regulator